MRCVDEYLWQCKIDRMITSFLHSPAGRRSNISWDNIEVEFLFAPHEIPDGSPPQGKSAIYIFKCGESVLKIGIVGSNTASRFGFQQYRIDSTTKSTMVRLLVDDQDNNELLNGKNADEIEEIIRNFDRTNILIDKKCGKQLLKNFERFAHVVLDPVYEQGKNYDWSL